MSTTLGLLAATLVAGAGSISASYIGQQILAAQGIVDASSPISAIPVAILLGVGANTLFPLPASVNPGLKFCSTTVLRCGIVAVGLKLSFVDVMSVSAAIPAIICCMGVGYGTAKTLGNALGLPSKMSSLIAAGTEVFSLTPIGVLSCSQC